MAALYNSSFSLVGLGFNETIILLICSMALGLIGSWLAVMRYLKTA
jgi:hypothetical protein